MDKLVKEIRAEQWRPLILEANNGSMKKSEWCALHNIPVRQFYYWQRKLRDQAVQELETSSFLAIKEETKPAATAESTFVELKVPADAVLKEEQNELPAKPNLSDGICDPELIIEIGRCRVVVRRNASDTTLRTIMEAVLHA